jgi:hypothetical protein
MIEHSGKMQLTLLFTERYLFNIILIINNNNKYCSKNRPRALNRLFYGLGSSSRVKIKILLGTVWVAILGLETNLFPTHFRPTGKANLNLQVHLQDKNKKIKVIL